MVSSGNVVSELLGPSCQLRDRVKRGCCGSGWFRNSEEAKEGEKLDLTRPGNRVNGLGSAAYLDRIGQLPAQRSLLKLKHHT